jgi:hypothetical protein
MGKLNEERAHTHLINSTKNIRLFKLVLSLLKLLTQNLMTLYHIETSNA